LAAHAFLTTPGLYIGAVGTWQDRMRDVLRGPFVKECYESALVKSEGRR
jgi:hypothetical protein